MSVAVQHADGSIGYESTIRWTRHGDGSYLAEVGGVTVEIKPNFEVGPKNGIRKVFEIHHRGAIVARRTEVAKAKHIGENFLRLTIDQILYGLSGLGRLS